MYGTTEKKITHIIKDNHDNGLCGFWTTICGKWIHPPPGETVTLDEIIGGAQ